MTRPLLAPPSSDLVNRVREVCQRSGDVRLLIPILHGLQKVSHAHPTAVMLATPTFAARSNRSIAKVHSPESQPGQGGLRSLAGVI